MIKQSFKKNRNGISEKTEKLFLYFFYFLFTLLPISETNKKHYQHINWHGNREDSREEAKLLKHYEKSALKYLAQMWRIENIWNSMAENIEPSGSKI